jgi:molybdenum cofactor cytidylyltransferase
MAKIGAVLLAAVCSVRFGASNKMTGYDQRLIERALDGLQLRFAHNPDWSKGMGSSIAIGVSALDSNLDGAFIMPGDMPLAPTTLLEQLIEEFVQTQGASIIFPATASGAQRNPVLWPRRFFGLLTSLTGSEGGKGALNALAECRKAVLVADDSAFTDIDTAEDLALARSRVGPGSLSFLPCRSDVMRMAKGREVSAPLAKTDRRALPAILSSMGPKVCW